MRRVTAALVLGFALAGCQTVPTPRISTNPELQPVWETHLQHLADIDHFQLKGRIASSNLGGGSADLSWIQQADHLEVSFSGALGVGALRIEGTPDHLTITTREGQYQAEAAEQALTEKLGAPLPIADLRYWVLGMPRPGTAGVIGLDPDGRLGHLEQDGWQLDYLEYRPASNPQPALPRKVWLRCGDSRWKLVIDQWSLSG